MTTALVVRLEDLVWRTRGRHWDFKLVCCPEQTAEDLWRAALGGVLRPEQRDRRPQHGQLEFADGTRMNVVAVTVMDEARRDAAGRPIAHQFLWRFDGDAPSTLPTGWGDVLLRHLGPALDESGVFDLSDAEIDAWSADIRGRSLVGHIREEVRKRCPHEIPMEGGVVNPSVWQYASWTEEKKTPPKSHRPQRAVALNSWSKRLKSWLTCLLRRLLGRPPK